MMKLGTAKRTRIRPVNAPMLIPRRSVETMARGRATSMDTPSAANHCASQAVTQPAKATADPTLRSISPEMMTMVMPKAMIPCIDTFRRTLSRLTTVKNPSA